MRRLFEWLRDRLRPTPTPPNPPAPVPGDDPRQAVVDLINLNRRHVGRGDLARDATLDAVARGFAVELAAQGSFDDDPHVGRDGSTLGVRLLLAGYAYSSAGECLAAGHRTPDEVVAGWLSSGGHRAHVLGGYADVGVGVAASATGVPFWVAVFGTRVL